MQQQEHAFCEVLDAAAEYVKVQEQLCANLRAGHFQLARARYAVARGSIGSASYSSTMQATAQVVVSNADSNPFQLQDRRNIASSSSSPWSMQNVSEQKARDSSSTSKAFEAEDSTSTMQAEANPDASADSQSGLATQFDMTDQYSSNAISELAAKFGTAQIDRPSPVCTNAAPKDPLKWFGFMVSPHLRQSQADFREAVTLLVGLANAQYKIHASLNVMRSCQGMHEAG
ncbi:hypothetical protein ABBQ32_013715 [Trebouxia sp. C0010 RCD-2024]